MSTSLKKNISFPFESANFSRETKTCNDKEELFKHIVCKEKLKAVTQIITAKISPEYFISDDSFKVISHYMHFKRYGIGFLYPGGLNEAPNIIVQCFDIIQNVLDKQEADSIKASKEKNKRDSNSKRTR